MLDIDKNVTYTINCEDFGIKHHLTIKNTYATVNKMGKNPPDCDIDAPIVVADAVWPQKQYEICVNSGLQDKFRSIMPANMMTDADYVFPASCATSGGASIAIRKAGSGKSVWIAPDDTTAFKAGSAMTKASGTADKIKTPKASGEYLIYVTDASGKILSRSQHILRISGTTGDGTAVESAAFDMQSGVEIENLEAGGRDVGYIENGDYIGFKNVDFKNGAEAMEFRLATPYGGSSVEIRLDAPDGERIGVAEVGETGGWHDFKNITTTLAPATGKHDLYLVFKGGDGYLFNLMSWKLIFPASSEERVAGDVNADGMFDVLDLVLLQKWLLAIPDVTLDDPDAGDMDGNESLDIFDLGLMKRELLRADDPAMT